jgi:hypothetical protein
MVYGGHLMVAWSRALLYRWLLARRWHFYNLPTCQVEELWRALDREAARQAEAELQEYKEEEHARLREIEREEEERDRLAGLGPNPLVAEGDKAVFDFFTRKLPRHVKGYGVVRQVSDRPTRWPLVLQGGLVKWSRPLNP